MSRKLALSDSNASQRPSGDHDGDRTRPETGPSARPVPPPRSGSSTSRSRCVCPSPVVETVSSDAPLGEAAAG